MSKNSRMCTHLLQNDAKSERMITSLVDLHKTHCKALNCPVTVSSSSECNGTEDVPRIHYNDTMVNTHMVTLSDIHYL